MCGVLLTLLFYMLLMESAKKKLIDLMGQKHYLNMLRF